MNVLLLLFFKSVSQLVLKFPVQFDLFIKFHIFPFISFFLFLNFTKLY